MLLPVLFGIASAPVETLKVWYCSHITHGSTVYDIGIRCKCDLGGAISRAIVCRWQISITHRNPDKADHRRVGRAQSWLAFHLDITQTATAPRATTHGVPVPHRLSRLARSEMGGLIF